MAVIQIKYATTSGNVPAGLVNGELAINIADGILFWLDGDGVTIDSFNFLAPSVPTMGGGDNSSHAANTAFVAAALTALNNIIFGGVPPTTLNTITKLAAAMGNNPNFLAAINNTLAGVIRFDTAQTLNAAQQTQVQTNMGFIGGNVVVDGGSF